MKLSNTGHTYKLIALIILISVSNISSIRMAHAQVPWREAVRADLEWKQNREKLPPFCAENVKQRAPFNGPNYRGDMTWHNHLCSALISIPICRTYYGKDRIECLNSRTEGYTYWISHAKNPNFGMLPYLHTGLGELYFEMGNKAEAIKEYQLALNKNPKYLKAYKNIIDAFIDLKQYDNAQYYLDKAMAIKPHKAFKKRQKKLNTLKN
jgi:tetratricopeptide (TPR) repeat protein|tara:strand:- start:526 stop:1152 length:627 start_codon:yes stop_codon:yes gene_type:complete